MEYRKLIATTLPEALKTVGVGETVLGPDGYCRRSVTKTCSQLKANGYLFTTRVKGEELFITRLK